MKFNITGFKRVYFDITVEADNEEEARDKAEDMAEISSFVGNGGTGYLCGVSSPEDGEIDLEPSQDELEEFKIKQLEE